MEPNRPKIIYNTNTDLLTSAYTASAAGIEDTAPEVINAIAAPDVIPIFRRPEIRGMAAASKKARETAWLFSI